MIIAPRLSIVVPARDAAVMLARTLPVLASAVRRGAASELIVVDDGSGDATAATAAPFADRVVTLRPPARGPSYARNAGVAASHGEWLLFVDADVQCHPDTLDRMTEAIAANPDAVAIFGAYDDVPSADGVVSQFRNLLHHSVHHRSPGPADTFWAGLGAVRRDAFLAVDGFDAVRFPTSQIEDIDLGYRLRDRGGRVLLDPTIEATHHKPWTLATMVSTDFWRRGVPWAGLLLERAGQSRGTLAAGTAEKVKAVLAGTAFLALSAWLASGGLLGAAGVLAVASAAILVAWNLPMHAWFAGQRGLLFALATVPLLALYYLVGAAGAGWGTVRFVAARLRTAAGRVISR